MAIDTYLSGLPEDLNIDGAELVEVLGRDGRKVVPISKLIGGGSSNGVSVTVNDVSAAAANVAAIQAALDAGGTVNVSGSGVAYINDTLRPGPNTSLIIDPKLTLRQAPNTRKSMVRSKASYLPQVPVTLGWTAGSGRRLPVNWPGHRLSVGDFVWVQMIIGRDGTGQVVDAINARYSGVFPVVSVTDANNVVVQMERVPSGPSTLNFVAVKADTDVYVTGNFDYDWANQVTVVPGGTNIEPTGLDTQAVVLAVIGRLRTGQITVRNGFKYCVTLAALNTFDIGPISSPDTRSDNLKLYGSLAHGRFSTISGQSGDDFVSLQPREPAQFEKYIISEGDIIDVDMGKIDCAKVGDKTSLLAFYAHPFYLTDLITVRGISGTNRNTEPGNASSNAERGVNIRNTGAMANAQIGRLNLQGVSVECNLPVSVENVTVADLTVGFAEPRHNNNSAGLDGSGNPNGAAVDNGNRSLLHVKSTGAVKSLVIEGTMTDPNYGSAGNTYPVRFDGKVDNIVIKMKYACHLSSRFITYGANATVGRVTFAEESDITANHMFSPTAAGLAVPEVVFRGIARGYTGVSSAFSVDLTVQGGRFTDMRDGILRASGTGTFNFRSTGKRRDSGVDIVVTGGTPIINPLSDEISFDVTNAAIARATGNKLNNTNAAAGTLGAAGPVVSQGTAAGSWRLLADTTKSY